MSGARLRRRKRVPFVREPRAGSHAMRSPRHAPMYKGSACVRRTCHHLSADSPPTGTRENPRPTILVYYARL
jgi:hypothetical protein